MELKKEYKMFIGGEWISSEKTVEVKNPFDQSVISKVHMAKPEHIEKAIISSQKAFLEMKKMPAYKRRDILLRIAKVLEENLDFYAKVLCMESGKSIRDSTGEIKRAISTLTLSAEEATRIEGKLMPLDITAVGEGREGIIKRFPIGPILGISPFNYPLNLAMHKIAPAIASGNTIVLKPATSTPLSCLLFAEIVEKTDLPKGAINILPMDRETADPIVSDERFKLLSFTGSPQVGWDMKKRAGKKKVVLELGGNAGVVLDSDSDISFAAKRVAIGAFSYQGQVCISVQRAFVHEKIYDDFAKALIKEIKGLKIGNPIDPDTDFGPMIDEKNAIRIESWVKEALSNGAKILHGGKRNGPLFEPTVLTEADDKDKVYCVEAFGPILTLEKFSDFDKVLERVNDSRYGLQAGIFTNDIRKIMKAYDELEVGGVVINDIPTFRVDNFPYGGIKESGFGREGVRYAIEDMTEMKILILKK